MKVYGFCAWHWSRKRSVRCIIAAPSLRAVRAACRPLHLWPGKEYIGETGNENELRQARAVPGCVLWAEDAGGGEPVFVRWR